MDESPFTSVGVGPGAFCGRQGAAGTKTSKIAETSRVMFVRIKTSRDGNSNDSFAFRQTFSDARFGGHFSLDEL
jgi:hypothetical protein